MHLRRRATAPAPFSFAPSGKFEGNDGSWSTFIIRVGTPAQTFRVVISTRGQETWVPLEEGCQDFDPSNCGDLRGVQTFQNAPSQGFSPNKSSTWELDGLYKLALEDRLDDAYSGNGMYGFDTVGLQIQNSGGPTLEHQIVAGISTKNFMFGNFQLGPAPTNFSDFNDPQPSFMWSLKNQSIIPSLSYGYSAGAAYDQTFGSLVLGGYDASQLEMTGTEQPTPNYLFNVGAAIGLVVGIQSITASNVLDGVVALLPEGIIVSIDSAIPELWLPAAACANFERSFGLQFDNETGRYLVNSTVHERLVELNPSITFKLGNTTFGGSTTNIVFPYSAFDLQAGYPIYENATNYFPIRRAVNDTQYVIGRTFLQEAYIVVDYERSRLAISQRVPISPGRQQTVVPILTQDAKSPSSTLSTGAIAGIAVGGAALLLALLLGIFFLLRRRRARKAINPTSDAHVNETNNQNPPTVPHSTAYQLSGMTELSSYNISPSAKATMDVQTRYEMESSQAAFGESKWRDGDRLAAYELASSKRHPGTEGRVELPEN